MTPLLHRVPLVLVLSGGAVTQAGDWAEWRGPGRDGRSPERGLPASWSAAGTNLAWKVPYGGRSTPIVMGDRLYLQGGDGGARHERVVCLDADTGKLLWEHRFDTGEPDGPRVGGSSPAGDPSTGDVYAFAASGTLLALDPWGKVRWERSLVEDFGLIAARGGRPVSPVLEGGLVIVSGVAAGWGAQAAASHRFFAFDKKTGATVYVSSAGGRPLGTADSPPVIGEVHGVRLMIAGGGDGAVHAIQPATGEPVWSFSMGPHGLDTAALLAPGNVAIVSHGGGSSEPGLLAGIDAAATGVLGQEQVKWSVAGFRAGSSAPVLDGGRVYQVDRGGTLFAFDAATGRQLWLFKLGSAAASPVLADGKLFVGTANGRFFILKPGPSGAAVLDSDPLGTDKSPEPITAAVAVSRGRVYLTTARATYCIGRKVDSGWVATPTPPPAGAEPATHLQVSPTELSLTPGDRVQFVVRLFDAQGRLIREESKATWALEDLEGRIGSTGQYTSAGRNPQAGSVKATFGGVSGRARVRVIPALPWRWDFENGAVPPQWISATGRFAARQAGGAKALVKLAGDAFTDQAHVFMGGGHLANYTVEADVLAYERTGEAGVVAQRYQLVLRGDEQEIGLQSWQPETASSAKASFRWKPDTWYRLKLRVEKEGATVRARGKAWPTVDPEPEAWTLERLDSTPSLQGSPGIYADAPVEVAFDNVRVTANGAAPVAPPAPGPTPAPAAGADALFEYDRGLPLDVQETSASARDGVDVRDITYAGLAGGRTAAYLVAPEGPGRSRPAVLFVHWFAPGEKDSNRTQFLEQAKELARRGVVSLLVETMWSDPAWYRSRDVGRDHEHSVEQVRALRRALDVLLARPDVDPARVAYVGHDFGAMYGAVLAGVDPRVNAALALQAGTTSFADWFLLSAKLAGDARRKYIERLSPLDPVHFVGRTKAPVYFQFAKDDVYVPKANADAFFAAAPEPKRIQWYEAGHGLSEQAIRDRQDWLAARLGLAAPTETP